MAKTLGEAGIFDTIEARIDDAGKIAEELHDDLDGLYWSIDEDNSIAYVYEKLFIAHSDALTLADDLAYILARLKGEADEDR